MSIRAAPQWTRIKNSNWKLMGKNQDLFCILHHLHMSAICKVEQILGKYCVFNFPNLNIGNRSLWAVGIGDVSPTILHSLPQCIHNMYIQSTTYRYIQYAYMGASGAQFKVDRNFTKSLLMFYFKKNGFGNSMTMAWHGLAINKKNLVNCGLICE